MQNIEGRRDWSPVRSNTPKPNPLKKIILAKFTALVIALGFAVFATFAKATDILQENFNYTSGSSLNGKNGGTGFSGAWSGYNGGFTNISTTLTDKNLSAPVTGAAVANGAWVSSSRPFSQVGLTNPGSTYFFTETFKPITTLGTINPSRPATIITSWFGSGGFYVQNSGFCFTYQISSSNSMYLDLRIGHDEILASTRITDPTGNLFNTTTTIAGQITFGNAGSSNSSMSVWLDPYNAGGQPYWKTPTLSVNNGNWEDPGANNSLSIISFSENPIAVGNIAMSTNYADLNLVPEPSTYALFGIGAIGMLIMMRRKKTA